MKELNIKRNVVTYNTLVHACVQLGYYRKAWQLVDDMVDDGVVADCATYTSLFTSIKQMFRSTTSKQNGYRNIPGEIFTTEEKVMVLDKGFRAVLQLHAITAE